MQENKVAHWVYTSIDSNKGERICDHCGSEEPDKTKYGEIDVFKYCPFCGYKIERLKSQ